MILFSHSDRSEGCGRCWSSDLPVAGGTRPFFARTSQGTPGGRVSIKKSMSRAGIFARAQAAFVLLICCTAHPARAADADKGRQLYALCVVCHATTTANGTGPGLAAIIGRKSGTAPGFRYSRAMKAANILWDEKMLDAYLTDPQKVVPGSVMPLSGVKDPKDRLDIIAYLKTL
jgi:cytochrome c